MSSSIYSLRVLALTLFLACGAAHAEVKVGVSDWTGWVAWYVAQDQGYFRKYGAEVKIGRAHV